MTPSIWVQVGILARRSIARTIRQPPLVVPAFAFPLFMLAVLSSQGHQITRIKGFPTNSYITFILAATFVQGATGAMTIAGNSVGVDIETGFLNRLALTPIRAVVLVPAQLAGVAVIGAVQASLTLLIGLAFGAHVKAGVGGAVLIVVIAALIVMAFASIGLLIAIRTGSSQQVQALSAVGLALLFMSSMAMPRNLMKHGWFKDIATYNPFSYLVEGLRSLLVTGWDGQALALGCGVALVGLVLALSAAIGSMGNRVVRT